MSGPHQYSAFLVSHIIWLFWMITLIFARHSPLDASLTSTRLLSPSLLMYALSLVYPLSAFRLITAQNSSTLPRPPSWRPTASCYASRVRTLPHKMARPSVFFAPSTTSCALCSSTHPCQPLTGPRLSRPPVTYSTGVPRPPFTVRFPSHVCTASRPAMPTCASSGASATRTSRPLPRISSHRVLQLVYSLDIPLLTKGTAASTWPLDVSISLATSSSTRHTFPSQTPQLVHRLPPLIF
jgi:hypothetical protein